MTKSVLTEQNGNYRPERSEVTDTHDPITAKQIAKLEKRLDLISKHLASQCTDLEFAFSSKLIEAKKRLAEKSNAKAAPIRKMLEALKG